MELHLYVIVYLTVWWRWIRLTHLSPVWISSGHCMICIWLQSSVTYFRKYKKWNFRTIEVIWGYAIRIVFSNSWIKRFLSLLPMIDNDLTSLDLICELGIWSSSTVIHSFIHYYTTWAAYIHTWIKTQKTHMHTNRKIIKKTIMIWQTSAISQILSDWLSGRLYPIYTLSTALNRLRVICANVLRIILSLVNNFFNNSTTAVYPGILHRTKVKYCTLSRQQHEKIPTPCWTQWNHYWHQILCRTASKTAKNHKRWYYSAAHWHLGERHGESTSQSTKASDQGPQ